MKNLPVNNYCSLDSNWWVFILRGLFAIIYGFIAMFLPVITVLSITLIFGAYAVIDGMLYIVAGVNKVRQNDHWWSLIIAGLISLSIGVWTLIWPHLASIVLISFIWTMISIWAISTGIFQLSASLRLRQEIRNEIFLTLSGILSIVLGIGLMLFLWVEPLASIVVVGSMIGINAFAYGILQLLLAVKLFKREKAHG
jgi:uncharacterized membrane protein HdeD (DUF308 family)